MVPAPGGLCSQRRPPRASTRSVSPTSPDPPWGRRRRDRRRAPQTRSTGSPASVWSVSSLDVDGGGVGVFGGVGQGFGHQVVGGDLDGLGQPVVDGNVKLHRHR